MVRRYIILGLFLFSLVLPSAPATGLNADPFPSINRVSIGSQLRMALSGSDSDLSSSLDTFHRAVLQFEQELTSSQIAFAETMGVEFARRGSTIINVGRIYSASVTSLDSLNALSRIGLLRATSGEKQYFTSLASSVPATKAPDVWANLKKAGHEINGSGVTVAVIDTGVNLAHPSFWKQTGGPYSIIEDTGSYYVDIDNDLVPDADEGPISHIDLQNPATIEIANEYMFIDTDGNGVFELNEGDTWLGGVDSNTNGIIDLPSEDAVVFGESKVSILYDQENQRTYVRGVNLTSDGYLVVDPHGHGTHVSSTIMGGQPGYTSLVGVAPGADLISIMSPLKSSDILEAIQYAIEKGADIINMSFSSYLGFLDGTDLEDLAVSEAFLRYGTLSTAAAGNLGTSPKHAHFTVSQGSNNSASLSVSTPPDASFLNLLWRSDDRDEHVYLKSPSGEIYDTGRFSSLADGSFVLEHPEIHAYAFAEISLRGLNNLLIQVSEDDHNWTSGSWQVGLTNPSGEDVEVDAYVWDNSWIGTSLRFTSSIDNSRTISSPGTADLVVTVGCYDENGNDIYTTSSRGPRIDGAKTITVASPGVNILAASRSLTSLWSTRSGTSMASPHVAGVLALIRQASGGDSAWSDYTALTSGAGGSSSHYSVADDSWGYGLVDSVWSVRHLLTSPITVGMTLAEWTGYDDLLTSAMDYTITGNLDILGAKIHQDTDILAVAVTMRSAADFSGGNVLTIHWDTDSQAGTGFNGVDIQVNLTSDVATVYEWTGSSFEPAALSVDRWTDSQSVFLRIQKSSPTLRGRIYVSTSNETYSPVDQTGYADLTDQWRPLVDDLALESDDDTFNAAIVMSDIDDSESAYSVTWSLVDGSFSTIESGSESGEANSSVEVQVDLSNYEYLYSFLFNVSDSSYTTILPPVLLVTEITTLRITSATLDATEIRVGPFLSEHVTGQVVVEGYILAETVGISFQSMSGAILNFSLSGEGGIYPIDIVPSAFPGGEYEVYAFAESSSGQAVELHMGMLHIIEDSSMVLLIAVVAVVGIVAVYMVPRIIARRKGE